jgi:hypothetical protein
MAQMLTSSAALNTNFESAALTANCSIAHLLKTPGQFVLFVWRQGNKVASAPVVVEEGGVEQGETSKQVTIDLFTLERNARGQPLNAVGESHKAGAGAYLVLYVSDGNALYYATLSDSTGQKALWDSRELGEGDIYSFLALVPGEYSINNTKSEASARMTVGYPQAPSERQPRTSPVYVKATRSGFDPAQWTTSGVQPVVIAAGSGSTFSVCLEKAAADNRSKEQRLSDERDRLRKVMAARFGKKSL